MLEISILASFYTSMYACMGLWLDYVFITTKSCIMHVEDSNNAHSYLGWLWEASLTFA